MKSVLLRLFPLSLGLVDLEGNQLYHVYFGITHIFFMVTFESFLQREINLSYYLKLILMALCPFLNEPSCTTFMHRIYRTTANPSCQLQEFNINTFLSCPKWWVHHN